jgi:carbon monoxide dehydrogenase subunit G
MAITVAIIVLLLGALLGIAAMRPKEFRYRRTTRIKAAPDKIFVNINDFHNWAAWSPYEKLDPEMQKTHSGPVSGKGSIYEWDGNAKVGKGRMEIIDASAPRKVTIKLDFMRPFVAHNTAEFTLEPQGEITDVAWSMYGPSPFVTRVMGVFMNMDALVGRDFETGLANLKAIAER